MTILRRLHCNISNLFLLLLLLLAIHSQSNAENQIETIQQNAVNDLLRDTENERGQTTACNKYSITCGNCNDTTNVCSVTGIDLSGWNIEGTISPSIGNLSNLKRLDLRYNKYKGVLPESFAKLTNLSYLYLDYNQIEGPIPSYFGNMKSLISLSLTGNMFSGKIPPELGELPNLQGLYLDENLLQGEIPKQLCKITSLNRLWLTNNLLSGQLPSELGNLNQIRVLYLQQNNFQGHLPSTFENLTNLGWFNIQGNNLDGSFPDIVFKWPSLKALYLTGNNFVGSLPIKFSLKSLSDLSVSDLNGAGNQMFPDLKDLTQLEVLTLRNCSLNGPIPPYIWEIVSLRSLDLRFNKLAGTVPPTMNNTALRYIYLQSNELTGTLPMWLTKNTSGYVDVSENKFSDINIADQIPDNNYNVNLFACCTNMTEHLSQRFGSIEGLLTDKFQCPGSKLMSELYINCGGNATKVNGSEYFEADMQQQGQSVFFRSPNQTWAYSSMELGPPYIVSQTCNLSMENSLLYQNARVARTSLKYYVFCLKKNNYKVKLHFAEIESRPNRYFNVRIQGKLVLTNFNIEEAAGGINLEVIREFPIQVNRTRLEIHLYRPGKGKSGPLLSGISISPVSKDKKKLPRAVIAGIALSASSLVIAVILFVLWAFGCIGGNKQEPKRIEIHPGGSYTFEDIKAATNNFSDLNEIGKGGFGSVYKGTLRNGMEIAVKKLSETSRQGFREFMTEVGTISAMNHPHLVKLIGSLIEGSHHLLIYEYMRYNSLSHVLFGLHNVELRPRLDWKTRVKMCVGIAKGLVYLHEEMKTPIVHRDITPNNILIDENLDAKISDFGFAKLFYDEGVPTQATRVIGTCGFMAPEQATRGILTTKIDVYSFGVVTLMIISGRNNETNRSNDEATFLLDTACVLREENRLLDLVDPNLQGGYPRKEAITILELALLCANQSPSLRPKMSEALDILERKKKLSEINKTGGASSVASNENNNNAQVAIEPTSSLIDE